MAIRPSKDEDSELYSAWLKLAAQNTSSEAEAIAGVDEIFSRMRSGEMKLSYPDGKPYDYSKGLISEPFLPVVPDQLITSPAPANPILPVAAQAIYSPDRKYLWDGTKWIAVEPIKKSNQYLHPA
jgi:hypothetical protein